jgi:hypothetical protein
MNARQHRTQRIAGSDCCRHKTNVPEQWSPPIRQLIAAVTQLFAQTSCQHRSLRPLRQSRRPSRCQRLPQYLGSQARTQQDNQVHRGSEYRPSCITHGMARRSEYAARAHRKNAAAKGDQSLRCRQGVIGIKGAALKKQTHHGGGCPNQDTRKKSRDKKTSARARLVTAANSP